MKKKLTNRNNKELGYINYHHTTSAHKPIFSRKKHHFFFFKIVLGRSKLNCIRQQVINNDAQLFDRHATRRTDERLSTSRVKTCLRRNTVQMVSLQNVPEWSRYQDAKRKCTGWQGWHYADSITMLRSLWVNQSTSQLSVNRSKMPYVFGDISIICLQARGYSASSSFLGNSKK